MSSKDTQPLESAVPSAWAMRFPACDGSADWAELGPDAPEGIPHVVASPLYDQTAIDAAVAAERERIRARLLAMDDAVSGRHNYYAHAAVVLFGPNVAIKRLP